MDWGNNVPAVERIAVAGASVACGASRRIWNSRRRDVPRITRRGHAHRGGVSSGSVLWVLLRGLPVRGRELEPTVVGSKDRR